jgi:hypothetical protein
VEQKFSGSTVTKLLRLLIIINKLVFDNFSFIKIRIFKNKMNFQLPIKLIINIKSNIV